MNTYFKKIVLLLCTLSITPISKAMNLDEKQRKKANLYVQKMARKTSLYTPVKVRLSYSNTPAYNGMNSSYSEWRDVLPVPHVIELPKTYIDAITEPWFKQMRNPEIHLIRGIIYHELGHAKSEDKKESHTRPFFPKSIQDYTDKEFKHAYNEELIADSTVPDEKEVLIAMRDSQQGDMKKLTNVLDQLEEAQNRCGTLKESFGGGTIDIHKLRSSIHAINSSSIFNEETAQQWDLVYKIAGQCHPSAYRRAHNFNERVKKIELQELERTLSFESYVEGLSIGDLLS